MFRSLLGDSVGHQGRACHEILRGDEQLSLKKRQLVDRIAMISLRFRIRHHVRPRCRV